MEVNISFISLLFARNLLLFEASFVSINSQVFDTANKTQRLQNIELIQTHISTLLTSVLFCPKRRGRTGSKMAPEYRSLIDPNETPPTEGTIVISPLLTVQSNP